MNDNGDLEAKLILTSDVSEAVDGIESVNDAFNDLRQSTVKALGNQETFNAEIAKLSRKQQIADLAKDYAYLASEISDSETEAANLLKALEDIGATEGEVKSAAKTFNSFGGTSVANDSSSGNIDSGLSAAAGALSTVGATGASEVVRLTGDIDRFTKQLPLMAAGFGELLISTGPLIIAAGVAAAAFALFTQQQQQAAEAAKAYADQITTDATRQVELNRLIEAGDRNGIQAKLDSAAAEKELQKAILDDAFAKLNEAQAAKDLEATGQGLSKQWQEGKLTWEEYIKGLEDQDTAIAGANQNIEAQLPIYEKARNEFNTLSQFMASVPVGELNKDISTFNSTIDSLSGVLDKSTVASLRSAQTETQRANALAQAEDILATKRQQQIDIIQSLNDQEKAAADQFNQQQLQQFQDRRIAYLRAEEDRTISETRAAEDLSRSLEQQETADNDKMLEIQNRGNEQVRKAQEDLTKAEIKAGEDRTKAAMDYAQSVAEIDEKYRADAEDDQREFNRRERDLRHENQQSAIDALIDNDINALMSSQQDTKDGQRELRRDQKDANRERLEQEKSERAKALESYNEHIQQIDTELQKQREATAVRIEEINTQTQAAIDSEKLTYQNKLDLDAETRRIQATREEEDRARMEKRQSEDFDRQYDRQAAANQQIIDNLNAQEEKQLAVYYNEDTALTNLLDKSKELASVTGGTPSSTTPTSNTTGSTSSGWWNQLPGVNTPPPITAPPPVTQNSLTGGQSVRGNEQSIILNMKDAFNGANFGNTFTHDDAAQLLNTVTEGHKMAIQQARSQRAR